MKTDEWEKMIRTKLGRAIRELRLAHQLNQEEFGQRIGISSTQVSQYEQAKVLPSIITLYRIAIQFGVSLDTLLGLSTSKKL